MRGKFTIFIMFLFLISSVHALEYTVQINSPSSVNAYEGENSGNIFQGTITNNGQFCDISCTWTTTLNTVSEPGATIKVQNNGVPQPFNFNVWAIGSNGLATYTISVNCKRILGGLCLTESPDQRISEPHSFSFLHKNDGICTTEREKCANYFDDETNFLKDSSCTCSSTTQCNPSSERGSDSRGCATYCGNKVKESQYETCNNCPGDVGKCDGQSCNSKSECEGNYCVHNKCSHTAYIKGDTYCDSSVGESCLNSPSDCACSSSKKCNSQGKCVTYCGNGICESSEQGSCKADCQWCGDGYCQDNEKRNCKLDCDWCGDGFCQVDETCSSCTSDCGDCKSPAYCGDEVCNIGECKAGCSKDCDLVNCQNGVCEITKGENCFSTPGDCPCKSDQRCDSVKKKCIDLTCGNGRCDSGETTKTCPNDCEETYKEVLSDPNSDYSIIFVHGHSKSEVKGYSPTSLEEFQNELTKEGYEDMGIILPSDYPPQLTKGIWSSKKISVITTYYSNKYDKLGDIVGPDDNQHIIEYAKRLRDVVNVVKHNTGKNKVIIIAHSMGGLVSRTYIKYYGGINSVDKLIMIGTPNHGTYGVVSFGCGTILAGRNPTPECQDMEAGSDFLINLNSNDETIGDIKYLTIIGKNTKSDSCPDKGYTDNVICASSVYLEGAENYFYEDFSSEYSLSNSLHTAFVSPSNAPKVYNKIVTFIKK